MTEEEREFLKGLPEEVTIYRGFNYRSTIEEPSYDPKHDGISWTLSRKTAQWFADRFDGGGEVLEKTIKKSEIFAYLKDRQEEEIIYLGGIDGTE
jgi:hypothetical protein